MTCTVTGCDRVTSSGGLCQLHRKRQQRGAGPSGMAQPPQEKLSPFERAVQAALDLADADAEDDHAYILAEDRFRKALERASRSLAASHAVKARWARMTPEQRSEVARAAAGARWGSSARKPLEPPTVRDLARFECLARAAAPGMARWDAMRTRTDAPAKGPAEPVQRHPHHGSRGKASEQTPSQPDRPPQGRLPAAIGVQARPKRQPGRPAEDGQGAARQGSRDVGAGAGPAEGPGGGGRSRAERSVQGGRGDPRPGGAAAVRARTGARRGAR